MKNAKIIALSAVTTALATVFLVIGNWFPTFSLSGAFMASVVMMMPLAKKTYKGAILSYLATILLTGVFSGFFTRWDALFPFALFSGLHPIVNYFFFERSFSNKIAAKILFIIVKDIWFVGVLIATHFLFEVYTGEVEFIRKYIVPILLIGGALIFPFYDYIMTRFQQMINVIIIRFKL